MYQPSKEILERYADVLVNCALNSGKGIKPGEAVLLQVPECAKPMLLALQKEVLKAGGNYITQYIPDGTERQYFELAGDKQLDFFPEKLLRGRVDEMDHSIFIIAEHDKKELEGLDAGRIMRRSKAFKPYMDWRNEKENRGKFTWTLALYGTEDAAKEAGMSLEEYWSEIIRACFLDIENPVEKWKGVLEEVDRVKNELNNLEIDKLHVESQGVDLWIGIGKGRKWMGGTGRNIPSFEVFISPDWRRTEGHIEFDQPLYRYGNKIEGINLEFKNGEIIKAEADKGENVLLEMIKSDEGAKRVGEYSLTDVRLSRISRFMAETLFDENYGGENGNTHIAIGNAYKDSYPGDPSKVIKEEWDKLGYNESAVHTDIISTRNRVVTAYLMNGKEMVIYRDGRFTI